MTYDLWLAFGVNLIINSFLAFITVALLVEGLLFLFRIRSHGLRKWIRLIPFCKLLIDPFLYNFSHWALKLGMHPLMAEEGSRYFSVGLMYPHMAMLVGFSLDGECTFSVADMLFLSMDPWWVKYFLCIFALSTLYVWVFRIWSYRATLQAHFEIPCVVGILFPKIVFPRSFRQKLTGQEAKMVFDHEKAHIAHRDHWVKGALFILDALFWWIPTGFFRKKIYREMECLADQRLLEKGYDRAAMMTTWLKCYRLSSVQLSVVCPFFSHSTLVYRAKRIMGPQISSSWWLKARYGVLFFTLIFPTLGRIWIF